MQVAASRASRIKTSRLRYSGPVRRDRPVEKRSARPLFVLMDIEDFHDLGSEALGLLWKDIGLERDQIGYVTG
jgi:hypothetical protein